MLIGTWVSRDVKWNDRPCQLTRHSMMTMRMLLFYLSAFDKIVIVFINLKTVVIHKIRYC